MTIHRLSWIFWAGSILLAFSAIASAQFKADPGSPFPAGLNPGSLVQGDFNGDGKLDLAIANENGNDVTLLLGNGTGGFTAAAGSPFAVGLVPQSLATGDFNGDGKLDLAITNSDVNSVTVLLGNGAGGFTPALGSPFPVGTWPHTVAVADYNGDGKLDLAIANTNSNNITILLGNGAGGFTPAAGSPIAVGSKPQSVVTGDFNGDGKPDLAVANFASNNVTVLLGSGTGGFTVASGSPISVGTAPVSMVVGDFNLDNKLDLAVANQNSNNVTVLKGNGSGGFTPVSGSPFATGTVPASIVMADFNADGKPDLAIANAGTNNVTVLLGSGTGTFTGATGSPYGVGTFPVGVTVGNFNGDGRPDLATANALGNNVSVLLNSIPGGNLLFQNDTTAQVTVHYYGGPQGNVDQGWNWLNISGAPGWKLMGSGDFDGNGVADLVWMNTTTQQVTVNYYGGARRSYLSGVELAEQGGLAGLDAGGGGGYERRRRAGSDLAEQCHQSSDGELLRRPGRRGLPRVELAEQHRRACGLADSRGSGL